MAIADSGIVYVDGYTRISGPDSTPRPGYAALFSRSGKLIRNLGDHVEPVRMDLTHPAEGGAAVGADGRFYMLSQSAVNVFDQTGELERVLKFQRPEKNAYPQVLAYSQGALSIELNAEKPRAQYGPEILTRMLVVDAQSGEQLGDYVFDPELTAYVVCFSRNRGYTLWPRLHQTALDVVPLR